MIKATLLSMTEGKEENEGTKGTTNAGIRITDKDITTEEMSVENRSPGEIRSRIDQHRSPKQHTEETNQVAPKCNQKEET